MRIPRNVVTSTTAVLVVLALTMLGSIPAAFASSDTAPLTDSSVSEPVVNPTPVETTPVIVTPEAPAPVITAPTDESSPAPVITDSPKPTEPVKVPEVTQIVTDTSPAPPAKTTETPKKVFVCKYVGTPGVDERPQTGQNPISVAINAIQHNQWNGIIPGYFSDAHDRSYVLAYDTGQSESELGKCPEAVGPPPVVKQEVGLYIYPLLNITKAPSWENSGTQIFCESKNGTSWFTTLSCTLPPQVCGPSWGYQQDKVKDWNYDGAFKWPSHIQYPVDNIGWPPIYDAKHGLLSELTTVPDCSPPPPVVVAPSATIVTVCTAYGPQSTYTLSAGTSDTSFQIYNGGIKAEEHLVKAGETYTAVITLGEDSFGGSTTVEVKSGEISLGGVKLVSTNCNAPVAFHPENPTYTCDSVHVPGTKSDIVEDPTTNYETGAVTTTIGYDIVEGTYYVADTVLNGIHAFTVTFVANNGYIVADRDVAKGDMYITNAFDGVIKAAIWELPVKECPIVTPVPNPTVIVASTDTTATDKLAFTGAESAGALSVAALVAAILLLIGAGLASASYLRRRNKKA